MKKLFGEFLLEKNLVTQEILAKVLVEQIAAMPSFPEIVYKHKLLSDEKLVAVLAHQSRNGCDFISACKACHHWSPTLENALEKELLGLRVPIGQLLVSSGLVPLETITSALDEYFAEMLEKVPQPEIKLEKTKPAPVTDENLTASAIAGYTHFFDERKKMSFQRGFQALSEAAQPPSSEWVREILLEGCQTLHALRGAARWAKAIRSEHLLSQSERTLESILMKPASFSGDDIRVLGSLCHQTMETLWSYRGAIVSSASEASEWKQSSSLVEDLLKKLADLEAKADSGMSYAA